jgi:polysaccharide pyruvyl transferase WcaK-like protein
MRAVRMSRALGDPPRIGLLGMYSSVNLGDTAIQRAVMQALLARRPGVEFVGLCTDPQDAARTFGIRARHLSGAGGMVRLDAAGGIVIEPPASKFDTDRLPAPLRHVGTAWRIDRHMRELDMLLVSGSGQIDDFWGGPWEQPFRLMTWCGAARRQHKAVAVFGVGVDQLLTRLGSAFASRALRRAQLRVVRDGGSLDALRAIGVVEPTEVCPDPAFHLVSEAPGSLENPAGSGFAVISPIARQAWPGAEPRLYDAYIGTLAAAADELQRRGIEVRFVCSQTKMDPPVIDRVKSMMGSDPGSTQVRGAKTVEDYMHEVARARVVIGSRLHAMILALVAGTPVLAISYARKVERQMQDIQLADFVLDLRAVQTPQLLAKIDLVLSRENELRAHISAMTRGFRVELESQFDRLAALIPR